MASLPVISAQMRMDQNTVSWNQAAFHLCYECGDIVSHMDYQQHLLAHEAASVVYQLYHFEENERYKFEKHRRQIEGKEKKVEAKRLRKLRKIEKPYERANLPPSSAYAYVELFECELNNLIDRLRAEYIAKVAVRCRLLKLEEERLNVKSKNTLHVKKRRRLTISYLSSDFSSLDDFSEKRTLFQSKALNKNFIDKRDKKYINNNIKAAEVNVDINENSELISSKNKKNCFNKRVHPDALIGLLNNTTPINLISKKSFGNKCDETHKTLLPVRRSQRNWNIKVRGKNSLNRRNFLPTSSSLASTSSTFSFDSIKQPTDKMCSSCRNYSTDSGMISDYVMEENDCVQRHNTGSTFDNKFKENTFHQTIISLSERNEASNAINVNRLETTNWSTSLSDVNKNENLAPPIPRKPSLTHSRHQTSSPHRARRASKSPIFKTKSFMSSQFIEKHFFSSTESRSLATLPLIEQHQFLPSSISQRPRSLYFSQNTNNTSSSLISNTTKSKEKNVGMTESISSGLDLISICTERTRMLTFCGQLKKNPMLSINVNKSIIENKMHHRSNSLNSLSSLDSGESFGDMGYLRIFTSGIKSDTDYVTLKVTSQTNCKTVVERIIHKFRLSFNDFNLFQLWMEVKTRMYNGNEVKSILELDKNAHPLELQRCHPQNMSRFILTMISNAILVRIFDGEVCPQSNYKSVLISPQTTCSEALKLILQMCRVSLTQNSNPITDLKRLATNKAIDGNDKILKKINDYRLFVEEKKNAKIVRTQIPDECLIADIYLNLSKQKIVLRKLKL